MRFKGKVAIITGGAQGLGEAIADKFASEGANVVIADINIETAQKTAEKIEKKHKNKAIAVMVDVTDEKNCQDMVSKAVKEFGKIDILVANAGILIAEEITEFPVEKWKKVIEVDLIGYFICAKEVAKVMKQQKSGSIIQINSKSGKKGSFKNSAYAASKFGGIGLTQSIALDLAPS